MALKILLAACLLLFAIDGYTKSLCKETEKVVFSFKINKTEKFTSLCKSENEKYLVYRFGTPSRIELSYPDVLDDSSWQKFTFSGYRRPGGKENAGMGDYSLSFNIKNYEYSVFQQWSYEDDTFDIGVNVSVNGKARVLAGNVKTQEGSLVLLENEKKRLPNQNDQ